jgi:hypothetical protein
MNNRLSYAFAACLVLVVALDVLLNDGKASIFLARKFLDLIQLVSFWR